MTALLVRLDAGLERHRVAALLHAFKQYPGVGAVADLSNVSWETLLLLTDDVLYKPEPEVAQPKKRRKAKAAA